MTFEWNLVLQTHKSCPLLLVPIPYPKPNGLVILIAYLYCKGCPEAIIWCLRSRSPTRRQRIGEQWCCADTVAQHRKRLWWIPPTRPITPHPTNAAGVSLPMKCLKTISMWWVADHSYVITWAQHKSHDFHILDTQQLLTEMVKGLMFGPKF